VAEFLRLGLLVAVAVGATYGALWVWRDGRERGLGGVALGWALGTALLFPALFPIYVLIERPRRPEERTWDLPEVLGVATLVVVTLPLLVSLAGGLVVRFESLVGAVLLQSALFVGGCVYVARARYGLPLQALGYRTDRWMRDTVVGMVVGVPLVLAVHHLVQPASVYLLGLLIGHDRAHALALREEAMNPIVQALPPLEESERVVLMALVVVVLVPAAEETFFRGFVYPALRRHLGVGRAALVSAAFFAAVHLQVVNFLPILLLGTALALAYEHTGSLVPAVVIHGVNNLVALISAYAGR
jgi:membrane protease YdiL (CAAX protease family)